MPALFRIAMQANRWSSALSIAPARLRARVHDRYSGEWKLSDHCDRRRSEHLIPGCDPPIRRLGYAEADVVLTTTGDADRITDDVR
jgi:hypothetical protein